eukprot:scaffold17.g513.t1
MEAEQRAVVTFLSGELGEAAPVEEEVAHFLASAAADAGSDDVDELRDLLIGFVPRLESLPPTEQDALTRRLIAAVASASLDGQRQPAGQAQPRQVVTQPAGAAPHKPADQQLPKLSLSVAARPTRPSRSGDSSACSTPLARAHEEQATPDEAAAVEMLCAVCPLPEPDNGFLLHILRLHGGGDAAAAAAAWLLDGCVDLGAAQAAWQRQARERKERAAREAAKQEELRRRIVGRFQLEAVPTGGGGRAGKQQQQQQLKAWQPAEGAKGGGQAAGRVRYLDGQVVTGKGEKYVVVKSGDEWDGGSRGKVYSKGKRGKGFY